MHCFCAKYSTVGPAPCTPAGASTAAPTAAALADKKKDEAAAKKKADAAFDALRDPVELARVRAHFDAAPTPRVREEWLAALAHFTVKYQS